MTKMIKNYIITYITKDINFWSDHKWPVSNHIWKQNIRCVVATQNIQNI